MDINTLGWMGEKVDKARKIAKDIEKVHELIVLLGNNNCKSYRVYFSDCGYDKKVHSYISIDDSTVKEFVMEQALQRLKELEAKLEAL